MSVKINLQCPNCGIQKNVLVPRDYIKENLTGTAILKVPINMICQHAFFAYIDKNFVVRDYLQPQFNLNDRQKLVRENLLFKIKDFKQVNIDFKFALSFISETDLRSLIYACFIESPIIIIENDYEHPRFLMLIAILKSIFPQMLETCLFFTTDEYLAYSESHKENIKHFTIYNLVYKLSVQKPFLDHQAEPLENFLENLCQKNSKMELIQCKNKFDYLIKFSDEIMDYPGSDNAILSKLMKKRYPEHKEIFSLQNIAIMRERLNFTHLLSFPELDSSSSIGPIYIWNDNLKDAEVDAIQNVIEKICVKAIQEFHEISALDLIEYLQKYAVVKMAKLDPNSLIKLMSKYIKKNWIIKK